MNISIASDSFFPKNTNSGPIKLKKCQLERSFHYAAFSRCTKSYGFSAPEKAGGGQGPPKLAPSPHNIYKPGNTINRAQNALCVSILKIIIPPEAPSPVNFIGWRPGCVSSVAVVNYQIHVTNAVMATVISRMRV